MTITLQGLLVYDYILHKFQQEKVDKIIISMSELLKAINLENNHDNIYKYLDSLQQTRIGSRDAREKLWGAFNLLAVFQKRAFKCVHSIIFYDIFKKYEKVNIPIFSIDELKELTGTGSKYKTYADFKRYVLEKALNEINLFDKKYQYGFVEERLGRRMDKIKFVRVDKDTIEVEENSMSEKILKAVLKARKNIYVNRVYSQKAMDKLILKYDEVDIIKGLNELYKYNYEIENFSKILNSKIKDIVDSKKVKVKKELTRIAKPEFEASEKSELDIEKERLSLVILNSKLPTRERIILFGELSVIEDMEDLKELEKRIK